MMVQLQFCSSAHRWTIICVYDQVGPLSFSWPNTNLICNCMLAQLYTHVERMLCCADMLICGWYYTLDIYNLCSMYLHAAFSNWLYVGHMVLHLCIVRWSKYYPYLQKDCFSVAFALILLTHLISGSLITYLSWRTLPFLKSTISLDSFCKTKRLLASPHYWHWYSGRHAAFVRSAPSTAFTASA